MTDFLRPWLLGLALLLAWSGACFYTGDRLRNAAWLQQQATQQQAARQQLQQLQAEQARGDALTTGLLTQQATIDQLTQEAQRAITTQTTGRACFDPAALRVLQRAPGITLMPAAASGTAAAPGAAASAADNAVASDTAVARWAIDAGAGYEACRLRLDALIDWHTHECSAP